MLAFISLAEFLCDISGIVCQAAWDVERYLMHLSLFGMNKSKPPGHMAHHTIIGSSCPINTLATTALALTLISSPSAISLDSSLKSYGMQLEQGYIGTTGLYRREKVSVHEGYLFRHGARLDEQAMPAAGVPGLATIRVAPGNRRGPHDTSAVALTSWFQHHVEWLSPVPDTARLCVLSAEAACILMLSMQAVVAPLFIPSLLLLALTVDTLLHGFDPCQIMVPDHHHFHFASLMKESLKYPFRNISSTFFHLPFGLPLCPLPLPSSLWRMTFAASHLLLCSILHMLPVVRILSLRVLILNPPSYSRRRPWRPVYATSTPSCSFTLISPGSLFLLPLHPALLASSHALASSLILLNTYLVFDTLSNSTSGRCQWQAKFPERFLDLRYLHILVIMTFTILRSFCQLRYHLVFLPKLSAPCTRNFHSFPTVSFPLSPCLQPFFFSLFSKYSHFLGQRRWRLGPWFLSNICIFDFASSCCAPQSFSDRPVYSISPLLPQASHALQSLALLNANGVRCKSPWGLRKLWCLGFPGCFIPIKLRTDTRLGRGDLDMRRVVSCHWPAFPRAFLISSQDFIKSPLHHSTPSNAVGARHAGLLRSVVEHSPISFAFSLPTSPPSCRSRLFYYSLLPHCPSLLQLPPTLSCKLPSESAISSYVPISLRKIPLHSASFTTSLPLLPVNANG
ncbi:predicted protein [Plenodomus lingam JN3]|uniref:Uncharacterized protein n=1 Tax=Leptosphaeria maculans (strain JN3 / isolate v23.1.3 / race Av1-4-5-6-7-8) TaxID=985895 RepID=M1ZJE3_LEPMJ|nr:predicted protein [Plenodomus lingam JN3]